MAKREPWQPDDADGDEDEGETPHLFALLGHSHRPATDEEKQAAETRIIQALAEGELRWPQVARYEATARCRKCGAGDAAVQYVARKNVAECVWLAAWVGAHECMLRRCGRCGYAWAERCLA